MTHHVMIDLETFGVELTAPIVQIGWVTFDENSVIDGGEIEVDVAPQITRGATIERSAVEFHRNLGSFLRRTGVVSPETAVSMLESPIRSSSTVWANSPAFDLILLKKMIRDHTDCAPLWTHKQERDFRTVCRLAADKGWRMPERDVVHTARADCEAQVEALQGALGALGVTIC